MKPLLAFVALALAGCASSADCGSDWRSTGERDGRFFFQYDHAGIWSGTAASWVDLHAFLPAGFIQSRADAIWNDGAYTYVAGSAWSETEFNHRAILWVQPVPEPISLGLFVLAAGALSRSRRPRPPRPAERFHRRHGTGKVGLHRRR